MLAVRWTLAKPGGRTLPARKSTHISVFTRPAIITEMMKCFFVLDHPKPFIGTTFYHRHLFNLFCQNLKLKNLNPERCYIVVCPNFVLLLRVFSSWMQRFLLPLLFVSQVMSVILDVLCLCITGNIVMHITFHFCLKVTP